MELKNLDIDQDNCDLKIGFLLICICLILHALFLSFFDWLVVLIFLCILFYICGTYYKKIHGIYPWSMVKK